MRPAPRRRTIVWVIKYLHTGQPYALTLTWVWGKLTVTRTDGTPVKVGVSPWSRRSWKKKTALCMTADGAAVLFHTQRRKDLNDDMPETFDVSDGNGAVIGSIIRPLVGQYDNDVRLVIETAAGRWTLAETPVALTGFETLLSFVATQHPDPLESVLINESGVRIGHARTGTTRTLKIKHDVSVSDDRLDMRMAAAIGVFTTHTMYRAVIQAQPYS